MLLIFISLRRKQRHDSNELKWIGRWWKPIFNYGKKVRRESQWCHPWGHQFLTVTTWGQVRIRDVVTSFTIETAKLTILQNNKQIHRLKDRFHHLVRHITCLRNSVFNCQLLRKADFSDGCSSEDNRGWGLYDISRLLKTILCRVYGSSIVLYEF